MSGGVNAKSRADGCGVWRFVAVFCDRFVSLVPDDEDAGRGLDDVVGSAAFSRHGQLMGRVTNAS